MWSNHSHSTCLKVQIFFSQSDKTSNISLRLESIFRYGSMSKASRVMAMRLNRVSAKIKIIYWSSNLVFQSILRFQCFHRLQIIYMSLQINITYSFNTYIASLLNILLQYMGTMLQYIPSKLSLQVASSVTRRTESRDMTTEMMTTEICWLSSFYWQPGLVGVPNLLALGILEVHKQVRRGTCLN